MLQPVTGKRFDVRYSECDMPTPFDLKIQFQGVRTRIHIEIGTVIKSEKPRKWLERVDDIGNVAREKNHSRIYAFVSWASNQPSEKASAFLSLFRFGSILILSLFCLTLLLDSIVVWICPRNECYRIPITCVWTVDAQPSHRSIRLELQIVYFEPAKMKEQIDVKINFQYRMNVGVKGQRQNGQRHSIIYSKF